MCNMNHCQCQCRVVVNRSGISKKFNDLCREDQDNSNSIKCMSKRRENENLLGLKNLVEIN